MKSKLFAGTLLVMTGLAAAVAGDVPNRTYDKLSEKNHSQELTVIELSEDEKKELAGKQFVLCMIGDSVTWAEDGDYFRSELLKHIPNLAFAGTHTAVLGYSHAGEGGNSTKGVLRRINDPLRVPDADYYHVLIGVNDCSAAKSDGQSEAVAEAAADRIEKIVKALLERPCTRKVFLGAILPSPFNMKTRASTVRERTGSVLNAQLRQSFARRFPKDKVVWIEYEEPLRAKLAVWNTARNLRGAHPTKHGYKMVAAIAAPVMKKHMQFNDLPANGDFGVEVVNLWNSKQESTPPLIPGWYTLSMELVDCSEVEFTLFCTTQKNNGRFAKTFVLQGKPGERIEMNFMTGYQNFGYDTSSFKIDIAHGKVKNIQIEKMRPLQKASNYTPDRMIDTKTPVAAGELLLPANK